MGSSEERRLQQGTSTAILQRQQKGCPWPKQLGARLLQITEVFAVAGHKESSSRQREVKLCTWRVGSWQREGNPARGRPAAHPPAGRPTCPAGRPTCCSTTARQQRVQVSHDAAGKPPGGRELHSWLLFLPSVDTGGV